MFRSGHKFDWYHLDVADGVDNIFGAPNAGPVAAISIDHRLGTDPASHPTPHVIVAAMVIECLRLHRHLADRITLQMVRRNPADGVRSCLSIVPRLCVNVGIVDVDHLRDACFLGGSVDDIFSSGRVAIVIVFAHGMMFISVVLMNFRDIM